MKETKGQSLYPVTPPAGMHLARAVADPDCATRGAAGGPRLVAFASAQVRCPYLSWGQQSQWQITTLHCAKCCCLLGEAASACARARRSCCLPVSTLSTA